MNFNCFVDQCFYTSESRTAFYNHMSSKHPGLDYSKPTLFKIISELKLLISDLNDQITKLKQAKLKKDSRQANISQLIVMNSKSVNTSQKQTNKNVGENNSINAIVYDEYKLQEHLLVPKLQSYFHDKRGSHVYICQPPGSWTEITTKENSKVFRILKDGEIILKLGWTADAVFSRRHEQHDREYKGKSVIIDTISTCVPQEAERLFKQELKSRGLLYEARHEHKNLKDTELIVCKNQQEYEYYIKLYEEMVDQAEKKCTMKLMVNPNNIDVAESTQFYRCNMRRNEITENNKTLELENKKLELENKKIELQIQLERINLQTNIDESCNSIVPII